MPTPAHFEAAASPPALRNEPIVPSGRIITIFGYGIRVQVERGHLVVEDGISPDRRQARSRVFGMACAAFSWSALTVWFLFRAWVAGRAGCRFCHA